jgi:hypothetical protein
MNGGGAASSAAACRPITIGRSQKRINVAGMLLLENEPLTSSTDAICE